MKLAPNLGATRPGWKIDPAPIESERVPNLAGPRPARGSRRQVTSVHHLDLVDAVSYYLVAAVSVLGWTT
jgi:hypothetical protein